MMFLFTQLFSACGDDKKIDASGTAIKNNSDANADAAIKSVQKTDAGLVFASAAQVSGVFFCFADNRDACEKGRGEFYPAQQQAVSENEKRWLVEGRFPKDQTIRVVALDEKSNIITAKDLNY